MDSLNRLRSETSQLTPEQYMVLHSQSWTQYFGDAPTHGKKIARSSRSFSKDELTKMQKQQCGAFASLHDFTDARQNEKVRTILAIGLDADLMSTEEKKAEREGKMVPVEEMDRRKNEYLEKILLPFSLKPHLAGETQHGFHAEFWIVPTEAISENTATWQRLQKRLQEKLLGDDKANLITQVLRIHGTLQFKTPSTPFRVRTIINNSQYARYSLDEVQTILDAQEIFCETNETPKESTEIAEKPKLWKKGLDGVSEGERNSTAASVLGRIIVSLPEEMWEIAGWGGLQEWNRNKSNPALDEKDLRIVYESITKKARRGRKNQKVDAAIVLLDAAPAPALPAIPDSDFKELRTTDVIRILGSTVKRDDANKVLAFLAFITVYTDDAQFNLTFQAPSASGKSYIALETSQYFPKSDVMKLAYSSPQAFFHEQGEPVYFKTPEKDNKGKLPPPDATLVNLEGKIIIFVDQPHAQVLERLRPILSHDEKEIHLQITDKKKGGGQRTKKIIVRGYPVVVFCTACLSFDEQEATRFLMLSPETTQGKLHEGILSTIERGSDREAYRTALDADPERRLLQQRVIAIKNAKVRDVVIRGPEKKLIESLFLVEGKMLKPRHQRDVPRFMNIMKAFALLNFMCREKIGGRIVANTADFEGTKALWMQVNESQEYNLSPYFMQLYKELIVVTYNKANESKNLLSCEGITKKDILKAHHAIYQRPLSDAKLRQDVLPVLETAGLIEIGKDRDDGRLLRITPLLIDGDIVRRGGEEKPIQSSDLPF